MRDDRLQRAAYATVEDYVAVPDCRVVVEQLDAAIDEWLADEGANARVLLVVMPPCDTRNLVARLARQRGLDILDEPGRNALLQPGSVPDASFIADSVEVLAIPRLERWFLRHRHGLELVRRLLAEVADTDRRCLIAVNAWGWSFVAKATRADLILPAPVTPSAFDAQRLRDWLVELAHADDTAEVTVRAIDDGTDVFALDDAGELRHPYLKELAARGRGIPWVCWQSWRRSLRTLPVEEDEAPRRAEDDAHTMWIAHESALHLPAGHEHDACLVLQALLIHAFLTPAELEDVLPLVGQSGMVRALERAGFIERDAESFRCRPGAYPSVRAALDVAGYPLPPL